MAAGVGAASDKPNADDTQLGDWARSSVYAMREIGIMQGKENNRFRPKDGYTQEQAVVTVERADSGVRTKSWTKQRPQGGNRYIVHIRKESPRPAII